MTAPLTLDVTARAPLMQARSNGCLLPMDEFQRMRITSAMVAVGSKRGFEQTTVSQIVRRAGVSRRTFYELFEDRHACFLAVFQDAVARAGAPVAAAYGAERSWRERIRAGVRALLIFLDDEPELARLCLVGALAAGPATLAWRREVVHELTKVVDQGRDRRRVGPPPLTAEGLVGGGLTVLHDRLLEPDPGPLIDLLNPLVAMIVMPYLGGGAARRELSRTSSDARNRSRAVEQRPVGLDIRITYRTCLVLAAIESDPGLSNKQLAAAAGIIDQGQISKLLGRLKRLGLIENTGGGQTTGQANAWRLTPKGFALQRELSRSHVLSPR
jgi:AcrR family transcriptional regulator